MIGVISDTHGLMRPEALAALEGVETIVHAGDVGGPHVLEALAALAPVHAIRGNVDTPDYLRTTKRKKKGLDPDWASALPDRFTRELGGLRVHVVHAIDDLDVDLSHVDVVITGHSHKPRIVRERGVLYLNPGSAGPRRFSLPVCLARLSIRNGRPEAERIDLPI